MTNKERDEMLKEMHKILVGNGKEGLCDSVRNHAKYIKWLWWIVFILLAGGGGSTYINFQKLVEVSKIVGGL
jgi:hypothetical protein